ncbi:MAG: histidine-type phosphatase [Bacteroidales bacterium]|nr:histidine-type phosphatase [Bacteroidales bacterium]
MKRLLITVVCAVLALAATAQEKDAALAAAIHENPFRCAVVLDPYEYLPAAETPVPKGFNPFYISHYGRHGSRSDWPSDGYRAVADKFSRAHQAGLLTAQGEKAFGMVEEIFKKYDDMGGRLTPLGAQEHRQIAHRMYDKYKKLFRSGSRRVRAISSTSQRCIISMAAFTGELLSLDPKLNIGWDTGEKMMSYISGGNTRELGNDTAPLIKEHDAAHPRDTATFMANVFTDPEKGRALVGSAKTFLDETFTIAIASGAYGCDDTLLRLFNEDDLYWHAENTAMNLYLRQCNSVEFGDRRMGQPEVAAIVRDIMDKADEAIATGGYVADLRFGHDTHLLAILARLGIKGIAERMTAQQSTHWPGYLFSPFAGNLQMVFYRNKAGEVLVKFYVNERETTLTTLPGGPYYRWEDVKKEFQTYI